MAVTFRTLDGKFASPKSRRKLIVYSKGKRLSGAAASSARKRARRELARLPKPRKVPPKKKPLRLPAEFTKPEARYMKSPFGKFTKSLSSMKPGERQMVYAIVMTQFRTASYRQEPRSTQKRQRIPFKVGRMTRAQALKLRKEDIEQRARNAGFIKPRLLFLVAGRSDAQRKKLAKRIGLTKRGRKGR